MEELTFVEENPKTKDIMFVNIMFMSGGRMKVKHVPKEKIKSDVLEYLMDIPT